MYFYLARYERYERYESISNCIVRATAGNWNLEGGREGRSSWKPSKSILEAAANRDRRRIFPSQLREGLRDDSDLPEKVPLPNQVVKKSSTTSTENRRAVRSSLANFYECNPRTKHAKKKGEGGG